MNLNEYELNFKEPDCDTKSNFVRICICGPSNTGKSYLFKYIARQQLLAQYDSILVFCGSLDTQKEYRQLLNTTLVFSEFSSSHIDSIKKFNQNQEANNKKLAKFLVIFDDFANRSNKYDEVIQDLFTAGRHCCISTVYLCHDLTLVNPVVRGMFTHIFILRQQRLIVWESVIDQYLLMLAYTDDLFADKNKTQLKSDLLKLLQNNTGDFYAVVLLIERMGRDPGKKFKDYVKKYKAGKLPKIESKNER